MIYGIVGVDECRAEIKHCLCCVLAVGHEIDPGGRASEFAD